MKLKLEYTCLSNEPGLCNLRQVKGARAPCPACRFKKCISLGMALDAAKKGRYSHAKRVETVRVATQYWMNQQNAEQANEVIPKDYPDDTCNPVNIGSKNLVSSTLDTRTPAPAETPNMPEGLLMHIKEELPSDCCMFENQENQTHSNFNYRDSSCSTTFPEQSFEVKENKTSAKSMDLSSESGDPISNRQLSDNKGADITGKHEGVHKSGNSLLDDLERLLRIKDSTGDEDMDNFIEIVTDAYDRQNLVPKAFLAEVPLVVHKYLVEEHCKKKKHPVQSTITPEHHLKVLRETGVDLDGRMDLFKGFVNDSEYIVKKTSAFCMLIPGFKTLSGDDRISLLKIAQLEQIIVALYPVHFLEERIIVLPSLKVLSMDFLFKFFNEEMAKSVFKTCKEIQELYFNERENALFAALALINPSNCVTDEGRVVCRTLREYTAQCLTQTLARRVDEDKLPAMLSHILEIVDKMAHLSRQFNLDAESIALEKVPGVSNIMVEMFDKDISVTSK